MFILLLLILCICVCMGAWGIRSPRVGVIGSSELPWSGFWELNNRAARTAHTLNGWAVSPLYTPIPPCETVFLCSSGWLRTCNVSSASASPLLGLQEGVTMPGNHSCFPSQWILRIVCSRKRSIHSLSMWDEVKLARFLYIISEGRFPSCLFPSLLTLGYLM